MNGRKAREQRYRQVLEAFPLPPDVKERLWKDARYMAARLRGGAVPPPAPDTLGAPDWRC